MLDRLLAKFAKAGRDGGSASVVAPPSAADAATRMDAAQAAAARRDYDSALSHWGELAHAGNAQAQIAIGECFLAGRGVEQNVDLAERWLTAAAEQGDAVGQRRLAEFYFKGEGGKAPDQDKARLWYGRAADQGEAAAQDMLSWMLAEDGETPDYGASRSWAEKAAAQGNGPSMTRLGLFYHNALGVPRDPVLAAMWWEKAAYADDGDGQAMLGAAYHLGSGRPRDPVSALVWLKRARGNYSSFADRFYEAVWTSCSPEQRADAERRAAEPLPARGPTARPGGGA